MTPRLEQIDKIYARYFEALAAARAKTKPTDGIFGFGTKLSDDYCNGAFCEQMKKALAEAAEAGIPDTEAEEILHYVCRTAEQHRADSVAYWLLLAVVQYAQPLIARLTEPQAKALCTWYGETYPREQRLPTQKTFYEALCRQAGEKPHGIAFWRR
jgi:hypothetical protein